jgi:serine/threonine protein kinase
MSDLTGQTLGKYHILARLGRGGMADVYQAYQPRLDRYVAVKILHSHLAEEADFIDRYRRAGEMARALREAVGLTAEEVLTAPPIPTIAPLPQIEEVSVTPTTDWSTPTIPPECPYRGLYAFQEEDAPFFFGRETFTEQLVASGARAAAGGRDRPLGQR